MQCVHGHITVMHPMHILCMVLTVTSMHMMQE